MDGCLPLDNLSPSRAKAKNERPDRYGHTPLLRILIQSERRLGGWAMPVEVVLGYNLDRSDIEVLGWRHATQR